MIFDTHAHYDDEQFDADREALLSGMKAGGVGMIVDAAATVASWDKILELTEKYPFLYGSVGVHPDEVGDLNEENFARMSELADRKKSLPSERSDWIITGIKKDMIFRNTGLSGNWNWQGKRSYRS